ncbi:MAG: hydrogenase maturation protease [Leptolinea sp.]
MPLSWNEQINQHLLRLWKDNPSAIAVIVGVGNEMMGDDAAGMLVVQKLKISLPADSLIRVVEGGPAPENCTGTLRQLKPGLVIFVDAGNFNAKPGSIALFTGDEAEGISAFGHTLPLHVLGKYIESELGCQSLLLLIQPEGIEYDRKVSDPVLRAVETLVKKLSGILTRAD